MRRSVRQLFLVLAWLGSVQMTMAQGTAFNYSGILEDSGGLATGVYDFTFSLSTSSNNFVQVGSILTNAAVPVTNGAFTVTLDFGVGVFTGNPLWIEIGVRTNGASSFTPLNPLQPIAPVPYAIMAGAASNLLGTLPASQLTGLVSTAQLSGALVTNDGSDVSLGGTFSGNGGGLTNIQSENIVYATNAFNGPTNSVNMTNTTQRYVTTSDVAITNLLNVVPNMSQSVFLYLRNVSGSNVRLYLTTPVTGTADGFRSYTLSNGITTVVSCNCWGGLETNFVVRPLW